MNELGVGVGVIGVLGVLEDLEVLEVEVEAEVGDGLTGHRSMCQIFGRLCGDSIFKAM